MTSSFRLQLVLAFTLFIGSCLSYEFSKTVVVDKSGNGQFTKIQDAIDSVPEGNSGWFHIVVNKGVYNEKVTIPYKKEYIFLEGSSSAKTLIVGDDHQATDTSSTFTSFSDNFVAKSISFMNSYNLKQKNDVTQAVAAMIHGDKSAFYNCGFYGYQDTLCAYEGRHYYKNCYIQGAADFIWGHGQSFFKGCKINVTMGHTNTPGYITAQGRMLEEDTNGFVFSKCSIVGTGQAYLGRAYGPFNRVIFSKTTMNSVVHPLGWDAWHFGGKELSSFLFECIYIFLYFGYFI
ncbi:probable pectinesterase 29 [Impatiens glandulifera]|uniref:probable pectinesterase 29 n=1 Tax=Impatiens glandulifera TaxID=253017 RepID=UPI001FB0A962|nr:probable pectinesterase 29 [Impatiens glandulifera]